MDTLYHKAVKDLQEEHGWLGYLIRNLMHSHKLNPIQARYAIMDALREQLHNAQDPEPQVVNGPYSSITVE